MKKTLVALALFLAACGAVTKAPPVVTPPALHDLTLHVFYGDPAKDDKVVNAPVSVLPDGQTISLDKQTDAAGNATFPDLPAGTYTACANETPAYPVVCVRGVTGSDVDISVTRRVPPVSQIRVDGRFWANEQGTFRPVFASDLASLPLSIEAQDQKLDEAVALGFNGVRVFAGALSWAGQTADHARAMLPRFLEAARARGLYVYVCALTDSGYAPEAHLAAVAGIVAQYPNALLEVANEIGHPTQTDLGKDIPKLREAARRVIPGSVVWTLGAPVGTDEPDADGKYPTDGGQFNDAHLDRGRDLWNQVRRLREIAAVSEATKKPAMSGEPIGVSDQPMPGKQRFWGEDGLKFAFAYGVLCRGFELGCVFHSENGLHGQLLGPNETAAAQAFLDGTRAIPTKDRLSFQNAGWATSPIVKANFNRVTRAYSFVAGNVAWTVLVGLTGDPQLELRDPWHIIGTVVERPGIRIVELSR